MLFSNLPWSSPGTAPVAGREMNRAAADDRSAAKLQPYLPCQPLFWNEIRPCSRGNKPACLSRKQERVVPPSGQCHWGLNSTNEPPAGISLPVPKQDPFLCSVWRWTDLLVSCVLCEPISAVDESVVTSIRHAQARRNIVGPVGWQRCGLLGAVSQPGLTWSPTGKAGGHWPNLTVVELPRSA